MPHIQIRLLEGCPAEQKRKIAERITDTMVEVTGTSCEGVSVAFMDVSPDSFSRGGVLILDRKKS